MQQHDRDEIVRAAQATWAATPAIRAEFISLEAFTAYRLAVARGAAKVLGGSVTTFTAQQARASVELKGSGADAVVRMSAPLELRAAGNELPQRFSGQAYSGGLVPSYGIVIDLASTRYGARMPLLDSHMRSAIVGVIENAATTNHAMQVDGRLFSDMAGSAAERIAQLAQRGAPFQMSVGLYEFTVETVRAGIVVTVNGRQLTGPVDVLRNGLVREVSIVTLGADSDTSAAFLSHR
jgi:hypothetical protein